MAVLVRHGGISPYAGILAAALVREAESRVFSIVRLVVVVPEPEALDPSAIVLEKARSG